MAGALFHPRKGVKLTDGTSCELWTSADGRLLRADLPPLAHLNLPRQGERFPVADTAVFIFRTLNAVDSFGPDVFARPC